MGMNSMPWKELELGLGQARDKALSMVDAEWSRFRRFQELAFPPVPPSPRWATRGEVAPLKDSVQLRLYGGGRRKSLPALVVTPQVNHSYIADFSPDQSLVSVLRSGGLNQVAVTDWLPPPARHYGIAESIDDIVEALDRLGGKAHLIGLCQGGWQSAIVAALYPERVASLTVAAAPIDARAGWTPLRLFVDGLPQAWFEGLVASCGGVASGEAISAGFDLLRAHERFFLNYLDLYVHLDDAEYCARYEALRNWYRLHKDIAGPLYLEVVSNLFKRNLLCKNRMPVRDRTVDLSEITCPVRLLAGKRDHITPPEQVFAMEALVPKAPTRKMLVDAGHIGVFMGRGALTTVWPELAREMASHAV